MWLIYAILGAFAWDNYLQIRREYGKEKDKAIPASEPPALPPAAAVVGDGMSSQIARGDVPDSAPKSLPSPIKGVSSEAWTRFCQAMRTQGVSDVSDSNAVGVFEMMPRRLVDLGIVGDTKRIRAPGGRMVLAGKFIPPMTEEKFTSSPLAQYNAFADSMAKYAEQLTTSGIKSPRVRGMTLSGALAVLHRAGPRGLETWADPASRRENTKVTYDRANGIF